MHCNTKRTTRAWRRRAATALALGVAVVVGTPRPTAGRGRLAPHPNDEHETFTGAEEDTGTEVARAAVSYWTVRATLRVATTDQPVRVGLLVPLSDGRQDVVMRRTKAPGFRLQETPVPPNLRANWAGGAPTGGTITYDFAVRIAASSATIPAVPVAGLRPPPDDRTTLEATERIQSTAPVVVRTARTVIGRATSLDEIVWSLYQHCAAFRPGAGADGQDAASVVGAGRGSSLGRARALVALLRAATIPARLVGGVRLRGGGTKHATNSWVEAWTGSAWVPLDPAGGSFGTLPTHYLALYRGDVPLIVHARGVDVGYEFSVRQATRHAVEEGEGNDGRVAIGPGAETVETHTAYVDAPVASVVLIADQGVPRAVTDRILGEARAAAIDCVLLTARFESRYVRETYLDGLIAANVPLIRHANLVLVATGDDAGAFALAGLGHRGVRMPDSRIIVAGGMSRPAALMLGSLLRHLLDPGEVVIVRRPAALLPLWEMARANLIDGTPMVEAAARWDIDAVVLGETSTRLPPWRRRLMRAWASAVEAQVPLGALTLILILPIIASLVVVARLVVGVETFGMFGPVIVSLAFVTTGLWWGTLIFLVVVGLGVALRWVLQRIRLQAVARVAILITLVAGVMAVLTLVGARLGIGPLLNISIFPMVIMSHVIEHFAATQVELGTAHALRMTGTTLVLSILCYLVVEHGGLRSLLLAYPELLLGAVACDVVLGKWRGLRLLEYRRFRAVTVPPEQP